LRSRATARRAAPVLAAAFLLALGLGLQLYFFRHYPQPPLFGDPAGYYNVGLRFQEAIARRHGGEPLASVFASVRGLFYLAGVGTLFAVLDGLRPGDTAFLRDVMALANTAAMFGVFVLARRLSGSLAGGLTALAIAATYATYSVQTGRLYPDPLTAALLVWAGVAYAGGTSPLRAAAWPGRVSFSASRCSCARAGARIHRGRHPSRAAGQRPLVVAHAGRTRARLLVPDRRFARARGLGRHPLGGGHARRRGPHGPGHLPAELPLRVLAAARDGRLDRALSLQAGPVLQGDGGGSAHDLLRSRPKQLAFTARYVAARPLTSLLLVLDNAYRLYDRPANDYKWDYPYPYGIQVFVQRAVVVLGVAGAALLVAEQPVLAGVFLIPAALAVLHGLVFPWPRYNVPAMPFLIASAGAAYRCVRRRRAVAAAGARRVLLTIAAPAAATLLLAAFSAARCRRRPASDACSASCSWWPFPSSWWR
jgi:hypothetical protein